MRKLVSTISDRVLVIETVALIILTALVAGLIFLNVVTRSLNMALYWVDELAIYTMVWMAFVGASVSLRLQRRISVNLFVDLLSAKVRWFVSLLIDVILLGFSLFFLYLCWSWYNLPILYEVGFNIDAFSGKTFNFIYQEPTSTIGLAKFYIWLAAPVMAITSSLHCLANLLENMAGQLPKLEEED